MDRPAVSLEHRFQLHVALPGESRPPIRCADCDEARPLRLTTQGAAACLACIARRGYSVAPASALFEWLVSERLGGGEAFLYCPGAAAQAGGLGCTRLLRAADLADHVASCAAGRQAAAAWGPSDRVARVAPSAPIQAPPDERPQGGGPVRRAARGRLSFEIDPAHRPRGAPERLATSKVAQSCVDFLNKALSIVEAHGVDRANLARRADLAHIFVAPGEPADERHGGELSPFYPGGYFRKSIIEDKGALRAAARSIFQAAGFCPRYVATVFQNVPGVPERVAPGACACRRRGGGPGPDSPPPPQPGSSSGPAASASGAGASSLEHAPLIDPSEMNSILPDLIGGGGGGGPSSPEMDDEAIAAFAASFDAELDAIQRADASP